MVSLNSKRKVLHPLQELTKLLLLQLRGIFRWALSNCSCEPSSVSKLALEIYLYLVRGYSRRKLLKPKNKQIIVSYTYILYEITLNSTLLSVKQVLFSIINSRYSDLNSIYHNNHNHQVRHNLPIYLNSYLVRQHRYADQFL